MSIQRAFRIQNKEGGVHVVVCSRKTIHNHIKDGDDVIEFMKPLKEPIDYKYIDYVSNFDPDTKTVIITPKVEISDPSILNDGE